MARVTALIGGQFGSEGKGVVSAHVADKYGVYVRTGGPNAGHSFVFKNKLYKMQCLPCGWINEDAVLVLGPGAVVNPDVLIREIKMIEEVYPDIRDRILVDERATALLPEHVRAEGHTKGEIHQRIGSTGEGVGAARLARIGRDSDTCYRMGDVSFPDEYRGMLHPDTPMALRAARRSGVNIMLEGTQGFGLSLTHGFWPYVTSHDTNAAQLCADAGLPPTALTDVVMVARTYPIRVAGNSGPLAGETTWEKMSKHVGKEVEERTTVTKLVRRIGEWDETLLDMACTVNDPDEIVLTFLDYLCPECEGATSESELSDKAKSFIDYVERRFESRVHLVGTGFSPTEGWCYVRR